MTVRELGKQIEQMLGTENLDAEIRIEDRATGEFYKIDELAIDQERSTLFLVTNSDQEGQR